MNSFAVEKRAKELFFLGFRCAESVLQAVAEHAGIHSPLIPKISTGFCGGISRSKGLCGAVSGGVMALGMILGRSSPDKSADYTYEKVREFLIAFENQHGSSNCFELIGCDFNEPMERQIWMESGMIDKCMELTGWAARMVIETIDDEPVEHANE
ncbi:MAG: C-GCAxxG-C-C family protein [Pseudomonadota bacterium]